MARLFDDAASQCLSYAGAVVTGPPCTMACWIKPDDIAAVAQCVIMVTNSTNQSGVHFDYHGVLLNTGGAVAARSYSSAGGASAVTSANWSANVWQHVCAVFAAANNRSAYLNGANKGTNTTSLTPAGLDRTGVGAHIKTEGNANFMSGLIAWPCIWNVALTDDEVAELASGAYPGLIRPGNIVDLWDLTRNVSPETPYAGLGSHNLTVSGATYSSDDPTVWFPQQRRREPGIWTPGRR